MALAPTTIFALKRKEAALFTLGAVDKPLDGIKRVDLEAWVEKTKVELSAVTPDLVPDEPYAYFQKILTKKSSSITISSLVWSKAPNGSNALRVGGVAKSRQALLTFQSDLNNSNEWSSVDFPVGAIAKESNIPFEISLTPQKTK